MTVFMLMVVYALVALLFAGNTFMEARRKGGVRDIWHVLGLLLCAAWPLMIIVVLGSIVRERARRGRERVPLPYRP